MKCWLGAVGAVLLSASLAAWAYSVGDTVANFRLPNVDGREVALTDYAGGKGVIVVFTCNSCPYAKAYEERIIELHRTFAPKGFPVLAIQPNDPERSPEDSFEKMQQRAQEKGYPFAYVWGPLSRDCPCLRCAAHSAGVSPAQCRWALRCGVHRGN
jgi:thiol-disulfide isomerase/thioredoxin